jgi:hypothetical protein
MRGCQLVADQSGPRSTGGRDLVDEIPDVSFDFVAWQAVARLGVWEAKIAADDEAAQPSAGQGDGLLSAEAAHHLHGRPVAHALENCARHVVQVAALNEGRVGPPSVVLQVNADAVHAGGKHALGRLDRRPPRRCMGMRTSAKASLGIAGSACRNVSRTAHTARAVASPAKARKSMTLPPPVDRIRSPPPPSMVFISASSSVLGKRCRKIGTTLRTPSCLKSGVPSSRTVTPALSAASATASPCGTLEVSTEIWNVNRSRNRRRTRFDSLGTSSIMMSLLDRPPKTARAGIFATAQVEMATHSASSVSARTTQSGSAAHANSP